MVSTFFHEKGVYLEGNDDKVVIATSAELCKRACTNEKTFVCKSFDFNKSSYTCYLSKKAKGETGLSTVTSSSIDYFERVFENSPSNSSSFVDSTKRTSSSPLNTLAPTKKETIVPPNNVPAMT